MHWQYFRNALPLLQVQWGLLEDPIEVLFISLFETEVMMH